MRIAIGLSGTDWGRSGIGTYMHSVLPRLHKQAVGAGDSLLAIGTRRDLDSYREVLGSVPQVPLPRLLDKPFLSAVAHAAGIAPLARAAGADVLLLPAANRRVAFVSNLPVVSVVHDLAQLHVTDKYDRFRMAYFRHVVLGGLRRADVLVAISAATRDDITKGLDGTTPPVRIVSNGVDCDQFVPGAKAPGFEPEKPYLLYPARLEHPGKNHLRLLRGFAKSRARETHKLVLTGRDWGAEAAIREEIARLDLGARVSLLGFVPFEALPGLVAGAEVVIMAGLHEGFGLPALEALASGRPVAVSNTGALPEVVGELGAQFDPLDEDSIAAALDRASFDEALRGRASSEGPAWARRSSWDKTAAGLLDACRAAVHR